MEMFEIIMAMVFGLLIGGMLFGVLAVVVIVLGIRTPAILDKAAFVVCYLTGVITLLQVWNGH